MKKFLLALLAGTMVMATASFALAEITISGEIETRYAVWVNTTLNHGLAGDHFHESGTQSFWDSRITLGVDAKVTEGLEGYIELQQDNTPWGNASRPQRFFNHYVNEDEYFFNDPGPFSSEDRKDPRNNGIGLRQAWINFTIPGMPVGMKIGHQPLALGHGIWLDLTRYGADSILMYSKPLPELLIAGVYAKGLESSPATPMRTAVFHVAGPKYYAQPDPDAFDEGINSGAGSDFDFFALLANYTWMENNTAGINLSYAHDSSNWISAYFNGVTGPNLTGVKRNNIRALHASLVADGSIMGLNYKAEANYLYVSVDEFGNALVPGNGDYDVSAWAGMVGADYTVMDMLKVGAEFAYGSGNRQGDPGIIYGVLSGPSFGTVFDDSKRTGRKDHAYATPYQLTSYNYAYLYNDKIGQGIFGDGGGKGFGDGYGGFGLANTTYVKLSVEASPMERLKAGADFLWLRASNPLMTTQSRSLGWEVDAHISYDLYDNLSLDILGGYFYAGPYYSFTGADDLGILWVDDITENGGFASKLRRDPAYGAEARLTMKF